MSESVTLNVEHIKNQFDLAGIVELQADCKYIFRTSAQWDHSRIATAQRVLAKWGLNGVLFVGPDIEAIYLVPENIHEADGQ